MIDMVLLGCCVSGAGCVVLADWSAGSTAIPNCSLYLSIVLIALRSVHRFCPKNDLIAPFLDRFALLFGHKKGLSVCFFANRAKDNGQTRASNRTAHNK